MNKTILCMLLYAACASSWWAAARWGFQAYPEIAIGCIVSTLAVIAVIIWECCEVADKK